MLPQGRKLNKRSDCRSELIRLEQSKLLVLLDRDGVINADRSDYVKSVDEWIPLPGSIQAIRDISRIHNIAVCTNQSAVGRGIISRSDVDAIHHSMGLSIDLPDLKSLAVYVCPHRPQENCDCRKPKPGLLEAAMSDFEAAPSSTYFVGDSLSDMVAASNARCVPVLVRTGNGHTTEPAVQDVDNVLIFDDLRSFANFLLNS